MTGLGARIKARRKELKMSARSLAAKSELGPGFISDLETGKRGVSARNLLAICDALGVSMDHLVRGEEYKPPTENVSIPMALSRLADTESLQFNEVVCLVKVAEVIEEHTSQFKLKPVHMDWKKLYEGIKEWL